MPSHHETMQELESKKQENIMLKAQLQQSYKQFEAYKQRTSSDMEKAVQDAKAEARAEVRASTGAMVSQSSFDALSDELKFVRKQKQELEFKLHEERLAASEAADVANAAAAAAAAEADAALAEEKKRSAEALAAARAEGAQALAASKAEASALAQLPALAPPSQQACDLVPALKMQIADLERELVTKKKEINMFKPDLAKSVAVINEQRAQIANLLGAEAALAKLKAETARDAASQDRVQVVYQDKIVEKIVEVEKIIEKVVPQEKIKFVTQDKKIEV